MNPVKILVVEDEHIVAMQISDILTKTGYHVLPTVTNYVEAVVLLHSEKPDIAILDINLEGKKSGIDLARYIKEKIQIPFIFLTIKANKETIQQVKVLNPPAYLVKPFKKEDLYTAIELALHNFHTIHHQYMKSQVEKVTSKDAMFIKGTHSYRKISFSEIVYAKSEHVYMEIIKKNNERNLIRSTLEKFSEILPENFLRVHRSYLINLNHLECFDFPLAIVKGYDIPVSKKYKQNLTKALKYL